VGVSARTLGLLLLLALVGGAAGYAYAETSAEPEISRDPAAPMAAADPAVPYTPPEKVNPDSELPPLPAAPASHVETLGTRGAGGVALPVPDGWSRNDLRAGEARWTPPDDPPGSYSLRVEVVDLNGSLAQVVAGRAAELPFDSRISDLEILGEDGDTLRASFIIAGYRRLQVTRWVSSDGNGIDLEVSATGRLIDESGLESLVASIATRVRRQPGRGADASASPSP
jgi:hypothetical protein